MIPHIRQADDQIGFYWVTAQGRPVSLPELVAIDDEPRRLVPTHLSALDDALIGAAGRWGEVLGGGRPVRDEDERAQLTELHRVLDRLIHEYAVAERRAGLGTEIRAGQIIGTSALLAVRARMSLDTAGPVPFEGMLDEPPAGVVAGRGQFHYADDAAAWRGGRWILCGQDGRRYPLTLGMLLFGSSGVEKDAAVQEHREALRAVTAAAGDAGACPGVAAGAIDWLLYDWLMAHRESDSSAAVEIRSGRTDDAAMIVAASDAAACARARADLALFAVSA